jgi:hypothetical protein
MGTMQIVDFVSKPGGTIAEMEYYPYISCFCSRIQAMELVS